MKYQSVDQATAATAATAYRLTHGYEPAYTKLYWSVANVVGTNQALLIQVIESWCLSNARLNKRSYFHHGEWWTSATYKEWEENYPALGKARGIQHLLLGLEKQGYVISCQPGITKGNAAKFYRVDPVKVGELLLKDLTVVQNLHDPNNTNLPIVQKMNGIVQKMNGVVHEMYDGQPESESQHTFQPSNKIKEIILTQSITGRTEKKEEEGSKATGLDKAVQDDRHAVNKEKVSTTNDQSTHENHFSGAARENDSQSLVFSSDPVKEVDFLLYYQTYQRQQGKDINSVASYVTTVLSKQDEGSTEVLCMFEQWKAACRTLQQKINNFADDPTEKEKQRKKYDFLNWEAWKHDHYYNMLLSEGLSKFCKHIVSAKWYEWASARYPERFVDIPD
ncbi:hypothetical protein [Nostoc parmelioides]|uniref:Replication protein n=1 Tax=Nostoc parmelioides FACHB-3921 TaxID=2692909 RepID=A0ABR8BNR4_9NOSO|nr:hypothetical protein [Nostoc parmelioides]MBD2255259.1 hypothetical protein [Nostoc parmelioides FACHB-3921]